MIKNLAATLVAAAFLAAPVQAQTTAPAQVPPPAGGAAQAMPVSPEKPAVKKKMAKKATAKKAKAKKAAPGTQPSEDDPQD